MMSAQELPLPPTPLHIFRSHSSPVTAIALSDDNERIYSADSSGKVAVTSSRSLRAIAMWIAHKDSVLGVEEWDNVIITHGRDNKLHIWDRLEELPFSQRIGGSAHLPDIQAPSLRYSMDVNALNFCRFSLLKRTPDVKDTVINERSALIALPNLVDSSTVDIWTLPSKDRVHAAIGQETNKPVLSETQTSRNSAGIVMGIHLYEQATSNILASSESKDLRLLAGYENGGVVLRQFNRIGKETSVEGQGWNVIWKAKLHSETIMAMRVSRGNAFALSVSADHLVGRYDLTTDSPSEGHGVIYRTKHPGNGSLAIRDDGRVCAVGGWDGRIRLYSTKSFKPLGTLKYHKQAVQCLDFARRFNTKLEPLNSADDEEDEMSMTDKLERSRWLLSGSKDCRVSTWLLVEFTK